MTRRKLFITLLIASLLLLSGCPCDEGALEEAARELATGDATFCGWTKGSDNAYFETDPYRCAVDAYKAETAFVVLVDVPTVQGELALAWVRTPEGTVHQFGFDSNPCQGTGCEAILHVRECHDHKLVGDAGSDHIECGSLSARRVLCD